MELTTGESTAVESTTVGIRDLKANLSRHLKRVTSGTRLTVTEHGRAVATIVPIEAPGETAWAHELVSKGQARWAGGKPRGAAAKGTKRPAITGKHTVSAAVLEDRR
jgi:prevent-host-death family protein